MNPPNILTETNLTPLAALADPYDALVRTYDLETGEMQEDLDAYQILARRFGGPLLDIGCGTGRVAFAMADEGYTILGVDISAPMLERARQRATREGVDEKRIRWLEADITALALDERFGLAIFAYNGFMHLLDQRTQIAALSRIAAHLKPGGGLAIDLPNPVEMFRVDDTPGLVLERMFNDPETGEQVMQQSLSSVDRGEQIMSVTWVYDRISAEGVVHRRLVPVRLRYTMAAELRLLLQLAGFDHIEIYGDTDFSQYDEDSPRMLAVAEKGREPA